MNTEEALTLRRCKHGAGLATPKHRGLAGPKRGCHTRRLLLRLLLCECGATRLAEDGGGGHAGCRSTCGTYHGEGAVITHVRNNYWWVPWAFGKTNGCWQNKAGQLLVGTVGFRQDKWLLAEQGGTTNGGYRGLSAPQMAAGRTRRNN